VRVIRDTFLCAVIAMAPTAGHAASPYSIEIDPSPGETLTAIVSGPAASTPSGEFRGRVSLYDFGTPREMAVAGRAERRGGALGVTMRIRYADLPEEWGVRFRPDGFDFHLRGSVAGAPLDWRGRLPWTEVAVSAGEDVASRFVSLKDVELSSLSPAGSRGVAHISVVNPFNFPLRIASTTYGVEASGREIGRGATRGLLLRPRRASTLDFPVELDHSQLLAAAGSAFLMGGDVDARLHGSITIRLPGGDVRVPFDLAGRIDASLGRQSLLLLR
jgi:LEA14-like dessication related protein